jgi:hypothetical protein
MAGNFAGERVFLLRSEERVIASGAWNQVKIDYKSCRPELRGNCGMSESRSGRSLQHNVDNLDFLFQKSLVVKGRARPVLEAPRHRLPPSTLT